MAAEYTWDPYIPAECRRCISIARLDELPLVSEFVDILDGDIERIEYDGYNDLGIAIPLEPTPLGNRLLREQVGFDADGDTLISYPITDDIYAFNCLYSEAS